MCPGNGKSGTRGERIRAPLQRIWSCLKIAPGGDMPCRCWLEDGGDGSVDAAGMPGSSSSTPCVIHVLAIAPDSTEEQLAPPPGSGRTDSEIHVGHKGQQVRVRPRFQPGASDPASTQRFKERKHPCYYHDGTCHLAQAPVCLPSCAESPVPSTLYNRRC